MKKTISLILVCTLLFAMVNGLAGCASSYDEATATKAAVCYVLANTANSQGLNLNSPMVHDTIYNTIRQYGYISVVNADGIPDVAWLVPLRSMTSTRVHPPRDLTWMLALRLQA